MPPGLGEGPPRGGGWMGVLLGVLDHAPRVGRRSSQGWWVDGCLTRLSITPREWVFVGVSQGWSVIPGVGGPFDKHAAGRLSSFISNQLFGLGKRA